MTRPAVKTLTYGLMHLIVAVAVAYAIMRNWQAALAVGLLEPLVQTIAYTLHERLWAKAEKGPGVRRGQFQFGHAH